LGDIYTMPISGGDAKPLLTGIAWEMQPKFSPDGTRIAFTSDRGGGDNLWTCALDGSDLKQITKESFRLLNSPEWTPDGQFIVGRKHFTSRRSLGAGEMWLYHAAGGTDGLQMTTKPTEQKDVGEPAFSPDGRYLYYSWDSTPGGSFEYNKDSNQGIYSINRLDRITGENETIISGPGGAIRPTPSPDGKSIAFVRRVRFATTLFTKDLASGMETAHYSNLERDMQESWAIHGVYPSFSYTPDGQSIIFYAKGGFHRINLATNQVSPIPFHINNTRTIFDALRFPIEVAPESFDLKMIRDIALRPDGKQLAYNALGYIYLKDLPDGQPRRLTSQTSHFESSPVYSRDNTLIAFTTWSDELLGSLRTINIDGSGERTLTQEKGHYVDPAFSPDGSVIVYGKVSGGYLSSPLWSSKPGVYRVLTSGDPQPMLVTRRGTNPQFGADLDRIYLTSASPQGDSDRRALFSITLDGKEERTHFISDNATEYRISPDGKFIAFAERFNVYITPFIPTGREVNIGPRTNSQPLAKVSRDGSNNLQWVGDGSAIYWSMGSTLYTKSVTDTFPFLAGKPQPAAESTTTPSTPSTPALPLELSIGFSHKTDIPEGSIALVGATIYAITKPADSPANTPRHGIITEGIIIIENNRIVSVGKNGALPIPDGATVIDCKGKFIMPGLIDVHAHGAQGINGFIPQNNWINLANLAFGVTTIHDPSNDTQTFFAASEMAKAGLILAPRLYSTGTILYVAAGSFKAEIDSLEDARFHLRRMKAVGAFSVKSYNQPRREQRQQVLAAARELNMMVVPEGGSLYQHNMTMVVDGHTGVEHTLPVEVIYDDVKDLWSQSQTGYTPTLLVGYGGLDGEHYFYNTTNVWEDSRLLNFVPRFVVDPRSRRREKAPIEEYNVLRSNAIASEIMKLNRRAHIGAHGQLAGLGAHWELWLLAGGGMSTLDALEAATFSGASYIGLDKDLGSIEPGKLADLIVLDADPAADIKNTASIRYTIANGRLFDSATMAQLAPTKSPRPTLWFEELQKGPGASITMRRMISACAGCGIPGGGCDSPYAPHTQNEHDGYK